MDVKMPSSMDSQLKEVYMEQPEGFCQSKISTPRILKNMFLVYGGGSKRRAQGFLATLMLDIEDADDLKSQTGLWSRMALGIHSGLVFVPTKLKNPFTCSVIIMEQSL
ncbi:hypothetical protein Tco_0598598 [Tanacetum coccineum]